jgi:hypothetical protein
MEAALRGTLNFVQALTGGIATLWSGSGGGLRGRGLLSAAGKGSPQRLETVCWRFSSISE